jgi:GNAT superfamily N-acetyltransferase
VRVRHKTACRFVPCRFFAPADKNIGRGRRGGDPTQPGLYNQSHNMTHNIMIRHPELTEHDDVHRFVSSVVNEIYAGVWSTSPIEVESQDWSDAWIVCSGPEIVGVLLTKDEWIDDLWIHKDHRGQGLGTRLLQYGEEEIARRQYEVSGLRVVKANQTAISFYIHHGWRIEKEFRHETLPIEMLELTKQSVRKST